MRSCYVGFCLTDIPRPMGNSQIGHCRGFSTDNTMKHKKKMTHKKIFLGIFFLLLFSPLNTNPFSIDDPFFFEIPKSFFLKLIRIPPWIYWIHIFPSLCFTLFSSIILIPIFYRFPKHMVCAFGILNSVDISFFYFFFLGGGKLMNLNMQHCAMTMM